MIRTLIGYAVFFSYSLAFWLVLSTLLVGWILASSRAAREASMKGSSISWRPRALGRGSSGSILARLAVELLFCLEQRQPREHERVRMATGRVRFGWSVWAFKIETRT